MSTYQKRYYWGFKPYSSKTGLYKGQTRYHCDGRVSDWKGNTKEYSKPGPMGKND